MPSPRSAPRRDPADAPNRRRAILLAAEKLFAERGYHAVSLRDIAAEAGVQVALLAYYYGAKHELYQAIFESWRPVIEQRRARLAAAVAEPGTDPLGAVLRAFVSPLVALNADPAGQWFARMAARELALPTPEADAAMRTHIDPMSHAFIDALAALFPRASRADVAWCYQFMLGAVLHFLADARVERLARGDATAADPAREADLLAFVAAGFRGVLGEPLGAGGAAAEAPTGAAASAVRAPVRRGPRTARS